MALWWRLIRFSFRLLYNELAFTYDGVSAFVSLGAWRCWQRAALKHLEIPDSGRVLELAHGTGNLQLDLWAAGYGVIGYDLSPQMGRIAQGKLRRHKLPARLARGLAQQLPFPAGVFAAVVSTFPTNFIVAPETLSEVSRVLQPGGLFVVVLNGVFIGGGLAAKGLERLYEITGQRGEASQDVTTYFPGFQAQMVEERCPRSFAQVIVARKRG